MIHSKLDKNFFPSRKETDRHLRVAKLDIKAFVNECDCCARDRFSPNARFRGQSSPKSIGKVFDSYKDEKLDMIPRCPFRIECAGKKTINS